MADTLLSFFANAERTAQRPWPRYRLDHQQWRALADRLARTDWTLLGLWAEAADVHVALMDETAGEIAVASNGPMKAKASPTAGASSRSSIIRATACSASFAPCPPAADD